MGQSKEKAARWSPRAGDMGGDSVQPGRRGLRHIRSPPSLLSVCTSWPSSSQSSLFLLVWDLPQSLPPSQLRSPHPSAHSKQSALLDSGLTVGAALCDGAPLQLPLLGEDMA